MYFSYENNLLGIDNYKQIIEIKNDLIKLDYLSIKGKDLKVRYLDKYKIIIAGVITDLHIGD